MNISKMLVLCEKVRNGEYDGEQEKLEAASKALAELSSKIDGRAEMAEIIRMVNDKAYNSFDIGSLIFKKTHFNIGDDVRIRTHKKGIKGYWTAPNSYVPAHYNYDTEITMTFEALGVRVRCYLSDLKTGKISSFAELVADAKEAIRIALLQKDMQIITQTYNATKNKTNYFPTNALDAKILDNAIRVVRKKTGVSPLLIGDYDLMAQIEGLVGFDQTDEKYKEIRDKGILGKYKGCECVYLPEILDPVTGLSLIPTNKIFIVGKEIGFQASYGESDTMQKTNFEDKSWECRYDKEVGYVVTKPEGIALIEVTA